MNEHLPPGSHGRRGPEPAAAKPAGITRPGLRTAATRTRQRLDRSLDHPSFGLVARTGLLLMAALVPELLLMRITHLSEAAYEGSFLGLALLERLAAAGIPGLALLGGLAGVLAIAAWARSLGPGWSDFEHAARLRWLTVLLAGMLAWVYASLDYNFYFDRSHGFDRLLLIVLVPLIAWRPVFTPVFVIVLLTVIWQFTYPIGGFSWAVPIVPVRVLLLFTALWALRLITKQVRTTDFLFVLCCMIAANYWASGWEKLRLDWVAIDRIGYLLPSTYANGWLGFASPDTIAMITKAVIALNGPAKLATLLVECGALLILWRRTTVRTVLTAAIVLHAVIFLLTGIGFWQWSVLNALVILLFFGRQSPGFEIFTRPRLVLSLLLIGGSALWSRPVRLAWMDARATYTYRLEASGDRGGTHTLAPAFFAPYDYPFTLSGFRYLVDARRLPVTWGATNTVVAKALNEALTAEHVVALEEQLGRNDYDPGRSEDFDRFVRRFVATWERRDGRGRWFAPIKAPATLWTFPRSDPVLGSERIVHVTVYEVLSFFDGERYTEIRRTPIRVIRIAS
jgi:hypothetical protein